MSDAKWTAGPWHAFVRLDTDTFAVLGPENDPRSPVVEWVGFDATLFDLGPEQVAANTHLIAAAPDLYAELKDVLRSCRKDFSADEEGDREFRMAYEGPLAALAKARGES